MTEMPSEDPLRALMPSGRSIATSYLISLACIVAALAFMLLAGAALLTRLFAFHIILIYLAGHLAGKAQERARLRARIGRMLAGGNRDRDITGLTSP
jgi:hypothetical protein